jgi:prevent-host-death family protein
MQVNIRDAEARLSELIERAQAGEEVTICKARKPVARLIPDREPERPKRVPGSLKGKIWISPDFDEFDKELAWSFRSTRAERSIQR